MTLASWDILNVYELLKALGTERDAHLKELNTKWNKLRDCYFEAKDQAEQASGGNDGQRA